MSARACGHQALARTPSQDTTHHADDLAGSLGLSCVLGASLEETLGENSSLATSMPETPGTEVQAEDHRNALDRKVLQKTPVLAMAQAQTCHRSRKCTKVKYRSTTVPHATWNSEPKLIPRLPTTDAWRTPNSRRWLPHAPAANPSTSIAPFSPRRLLANESIDTCSARGVSPLLSAHARRSQGAHIRPEFSDSDHIGNIRRDQITCFIQ
jgi:hypothetical protein